MGVKVTGLIEPISNLDKYPVIDPLLGIDGLRCVVSIDDMWNIPLERRRGGMIVGVQNPINNTTDYYTLKTGTTWSVGTLSSTDWVPFTIAGTGSSASFNVKYNVSNETILVPLNSEYLLYGNLTIATSGNFQNYGKTVIVNGDIVLIGDGTFSNYGSLELVNLGGTNKFSSTFSMAIGSTLSITHGLGTSDISFSIRDGSNFVYPNVEIVDNNNVLLTTTGTISSGRINIIA